MRPKWQSGRVALRLAAKQAFERDLIAYVYACLRLIRMTINIFYANAKYHRGNIIITTYMHHTCD